MKSGAGFLRYGYQGQFSEYDSTTAMNSFPLRYYDPIIGRWLQVDPMREFHSPYNGMGNNPPYRTDPDGGCTSCVEQVTDVISSGALDDAMFAMDFYTQLLPSFTYSLGLSYNEAEALRGAARVRKGQADFAWGALDLTSHLTGSLGAGISYLGYGAAFIPGAQPIAGGLIAAGNTLSTVSSLSTASINVFRDKDYTRAVLNAGNAFVPGRISKGVSSMVGKGQLTQYAGNILNAGINLKSSIADFMINSYHGN